MTDLLIHGSANSQFVRTACMACVEKGVAYDLLAVGENTFADIKTPEYRRLHPFGRVPAMTHGDFVLYETAAIVRYIDEGFDGPALQPADLKDRAIMNQWISATNHYLVKDLIGEFVAQFAFPSGPDGKPDMDRIEAAKPAIHEDLEIVDRHLADRTWMAGDIVSLADLLLAPVIHYVGSVPGGLSLFDGLTNIERWWHAVSARPSFKATVPPMLEKMAA